jgi:hypothetical protein
MSPRTAIRRLRVPEEEWRWQQRLPAPTTVRRDLVGFVRATTGFAALCAWLELSETVLVWTRPHERFQLDEIPGILLFRALAWYASRRVRDARAELAQRLCLHYKTVAIHQFVVRQKLDEQTPAQLIRIATQNGLPADAR